MPRWRVICGRATPPYRTCLTKSDHHRDCDGVLTAACASTPEQADPHAAISILYLLEDLLKSLPTLRVVYRIQDPRGLALSQLTGYVREYKRYRVAVMKSTKAVCDDMALAGRHSRRLLSTYPGRFYQLKNERLALEPREAMAELYQFAGRDLYSSVSSWIPANTVQFRPGQPANTLVRQQSWSPDSWRENVKADLLQDMNSVCQEALGILGFPL